MKPTPRELKEANRNYEMVSEYLIREGYATDKDGADSIIHGMSEGWYNIIVSE